MLDKKSIIPIYYQLRKLFERQIRSGELQPGDMLPSETEIASHFNISRMTVRRAIADLLSSGMVYTEKGKGTFVARPRLDKVVFDLNNYYDEIKQKGLLPYAELLETSITKADAKMAKKFGIAENTRCLYFRIIITASGEPIAYETKYTVYAKNTPILESQLKDPLLSRLAEAHSDRVPTSSKKTLMVSTATEEEAKVLDVSPGIPVFFMIQSIYDVDNNIIAWGKSVFRGDRYKVTSYEGWNVKEIRE